MGVAEKSGGRTHQKRLTPLTGFEVRAPHRGAFLFRMSAAGDECRSIISEARRPHRRKHLARTVAGDAHRRSGA